MTGLDTVSLELALFQTTHFRKSSFDNHSSKQFPDDPPCKKDTLMTKGQARLSCTAAYFQASPLEHGKKQGKGEGRGWKEVEREITPTSSLSWGLKGRSQPSYHGQMASV